MVDRFRKLGDIYIAPDARKLVNAEDIQAALRRHERGDWGEVGFFQRLANEREFASGGFFTSRYRDRNGRFFNVETRRRDTCVTIDH